MPVIFGVETESAVLISSREHFTYAQVAAQCQHMMHVNTTARGWIKGVSGTHRCLLLNHPAWMPHLDQYGKWWWSS